MTCYTVSQSSRSDGSVNIPLGQFTTMADAMDAAYAAGARFDRAAVADGFHRYGLPTNITLAVNAGTDVWIFAA